MITKRDVQLGKIALRVGMVSKEQLAKSIAIQKKLEKKVGLGAIWLKKGYITKEQLEEIVRLHNSEKSEKPGEDGAGEKKKKGAKKKKKKAGATSEAASSAPSEAPASGSEAPAASGESAKPATESGSESAPAPESKKSSKTSAALPKEKEPAKLKSQKIEKAKTSTREPSVGSESEVDSALFESSPQDESQEEDANRRVIACDGCGKNYRVKKKQVGKRFACRKCGDKIRVPKDLFDRPAAKPEMAEKPSKSGKSAGVAVEEFSLSGDDTGSGSDDGAPASKAAPAKAGSASSATRTEAKTEPRKSGAQPALKPDAKGKSGAAPAVKEPTSIAELAKLAAQRQAQPIGPKLTPKQRAMRYVQAALLFLVAGGIGGGIWYWRWSAEQERIARHTKEVSDERSRFQEPYDAAIKAAHAALEKAKTTAPSVDLLREITTAIATLEVGRRPVLALRPPREGAPKSEPLPVTIFQRENVQFALGRDADAKGDDLYRDLVLAHGLAQLQLGGQKYVSDAARDFQSVLALEPKNGPALALLGRAELARRRYLPAIDALRKSLAAAPEPSTRAWLGLACEAGDLIHDAAAAYEELAKTEPLAKVLEARALYLDNDLDNALSQATDAAGKLGADGEPLAAAHALRGLILERKGDADGADKAFDACVAAGGQSGRGLVARGEHLLRTGRFADAVKDFDASMKLAGGARAALGLGDAKAGLLDDDGAHAGRLQATTLEVKASGALLLGAIDAMDDPRSPDPRATAWRRLGDSAFAANRIDEARSDYDKAILADAFDAEAFAALARLEVAQKDLASAEGHVKTAHALLASANDKDAATDAPPLVRGAATARVLIIEALFHRDDGHLEAAEQAIDAAIAADGVAAGSFAYALKAQILEKRSDAARAKTEYQRALDLEESAKDLTAKFYNEAKTQFVQAAKTGDALAIAKTRSAIEAALAISPHHAHALCLRARLSIVAKKWDEALADLGAAIDTNRWFRDAYMARGFLLVRDMPDDRRDELSPMKAANDFEYAIHIDDKRGDAFYGRALTYWQRNDTGHALEDLEKALLLAPRWAPPYKLRADIEKHNNQDAKATADQKKYEELSKLGDQQDP